MNKKNLFVTIDGVGTDVANVVKILISDRFRYHKKNEMFAKLKKEVCNATPLERYCICRVALQSKSMQIRRLLEMENTSIVCDCYIASIVEVCHIATLDTRIQAIHNNDILKPSIAFLLGAPNRKMLDHGKKVGDPKINEMAGMLIYMDIPYFYIDASGGKTAEEVAAEIRHIIQIRTK